MSSIRKYDLEIIISLISDIVNTALGLRRTQGNLIVAKSADPHPSTLVGETTGPTPSWSEKPREQRIDGTSGLPPTTAHPPPTVSPSAVILGTKSGGHPDLVLFGPTRKPTA